MSCLLNSYGDGWILIQGRKYVILLLVEDGEELPQKILSSGLRCPQWLVIFEHDATSFGHGTTHPGSMLNPGATSDFKP